MSINKVFGAVFLWILINMVQYSAAFGCTNRVKMIHKYTKLIHLCANFRTNRIAAIDINNIGPSDLS